MMQELLAPAGLNISLTRYPDEYEIREAKNATTSTWRRSRGRESHESRQQLGEGSGDLTTHRGGDGDRSPTC